jgi:5-methylcytosine-specific restriction endonuclease McrA
MTRKSIPNFVKKVVIFRDFCKCQHCGKQGVYTNHYGPRVIEKERIPDFNWDGKIVGRRELAFEFDHILPIIRGGESTVENIVLSCRRCNRSRGSKLLKKGIPNGEC